MMDSDEEEEVRKITEMLFASEAIGSFSLHSFMPFYITLSIEF